MEIWTFFFHVESYIILSSWQFRQNTRLRNAHLIPDDTNINGRILNFFSYRSISNRLVRVVKIFFFDRSSTPKAIFS